jgi:hypothetical protein
MPPAHDWFTTPRAQGSVVTRPHPRLCAGRQLRRRGPDPGEGGKTASSDLLRARDTGAIAVERRGRDSSRGVKAPPRVSACGHAGPAAAPTTQISQHGEAIRGAAPRTILLGTRTKVVVYPLFAS